MPMTQTGSRDLPLQGLRVLDFTRVLAGPFCTMLLGDMGAEVIKIEDPDHGDDTRAWAPFVGGWSTYFLTVNRNKKSVALDLKSAEGAALVERLICSADVLVENFRPGTLERLGFGPDRARDMNERLIYCSISGYGTTGPRSNEPGYDTVIQGESGLMDVTGFPETGPTRVGVAISDCLAALYAVQGILLAHIQRERTGKGSSSTSRSSTRPCRSLAFLRALLPRPAGALASGATNIRRSRRTNPIPPRMARSSSQSATPVSGRGSVRRSGQGPSSTIPDLQETPNVSPTGRP